MYFFARVLYGSRFESKPLPIQTAAGVICHYAQYVHVNILFQTFANKSVSPYGRIRERTTMRAELIGHFQPCMTEIYLHIDARMADYIRTHP